MEKIAASLESQTQGPAVANLQDALLFLFRHGLFVTRDAPNSPTKDELAEIVKALADERTKQFYGEATQRLVLWWQLQSGLGDNRKGDVDDETAASLNDYLQKYGAFEPSADTRCIVRGRVTGGDGQSLADLVVRAFDKDLRIPFLLGDTRTNAQGAYEIAYLPHAAAAADAAPVGADLFVEVVDSAAEDAPALASSEVRFNAGPVEVVDFVIVNLGETEFPRITKAVLPLLEGQGAVVKSTTRSSAVRAASPRAALRPEELNNSDTTFLSRETGFDTDGLTAWIASARMRSELVTFLAEKDEKGFAAHIKVLGSGQAWAFFYAVRRANPQQALPDLLRLGRARWAEISTAGVAARRIDALKNEAVLFDALELADKVFAIDPTRTRDSQLARAAALAQLPVDLALKAADIEAGRGDALKPDDFLRLAEDQEDARPAVNRLVRTLRLQALTGYDESLSAAILAKMEASEGHTLAPLAVFSTHDWASLVADAAGDAADASTMQTRALQLQQQVEQTHPLESLGARFSANPTLYEDAGFREGAAFLKEYGVADEEGEIAIVSALNDPLGTRLPGDAGVAISNLGLYGKGGVNLDIAAALIKHGLKTPADLINHWPLGGDKLDLGDLTLPPQFLEDARDRMREAAATGFGLWVDGKLTGLVVGGKLTGQGKGESTGPSDGEYQSVEPSFAGIFGALDECLCQPNESVLGLPAYLADLLHALGALAATGTSYRSALEALKLRRPDIVNLPLSRENADRQVLHIELAVRAMEDVVAGAVPDIPTAATHEEAATQLLRQASYPWNLPYDGERDLAVSFCERLGMHRARLLSSALSRPLKEAAAAWLGIPLPSAGTLSEWRLLTTAAVQNDVWAHYGFADATSVTVLDPVNGKNRTGTPGELLKRLSILLDRTELDLETLTQLMACRSISPHARLTIRHEDASHPCKVSEMTLSDNSPALFDRLHRFVRLWRRLDGWSVEELDGALLALANSDVNAAMVLTDDKLAALGHMQRAKAALGLSPAELLGLYPSIATAAQALLLSRALRLDAAETAYLVDIFGINGPAATPAEWFQRLALLGELVPEIIAAGVTPATLRALLMRDATSTVDFSGLRDDLAATVKQALSSELALVFGKDRIDVVIREIADPKNDPGVVDMMTRRDKLDSLPDESPLFTAADWEASLRDASVALRYNAVLAHIHTRYGDDGKKRIAYETLREQALIEAVQKWATRLAESQAPWPVALIDRLLGQGLTLDSSASVTTARELLLGDSFLAGSTNGEPPELAAWARQLKLLLIGAPLLGTSDAWLTLESLDWRLFLEQEAPADRMKLVYLLLAAQPGRLSLAVVQLMLAEVAPSTAATTWKDRLAILDERLGSSVATLIELVTGAAPADTDNTEALEALRALQRPEVLYHLARLAAEARRLRVSGPQMAALLDPSLSVVAAQARQVLVARLGTDTAKEAEQVVRNHWLATRRDALVGWLVARGQVGDAIVRDANDLYERLLIDPEMAPCFKTTPVLAAIGAVQLFVQRLLFGLEPDVSVDVDALDTFRQRWEWMRSYRLWEANRRVFLFPENWLFPELRDDKSPAFKALEAALSRGELTQDIAEDAFGAFLDDVAHEGQIQVQGMFEDVGGDRRDLYLIGRTPNPPYKYYWRYCTDFGEQVMAWRPWEAIEFDIGTDHVIPFVLDGRLNLAWPALRLLEEAEDDGEKDRWQLDMNWTSLSGTGWRPIKSSRSDGLDRVGNRKPKNEFEFPAFADDRVGMTFRYEPEPGGSNILIRAYLQGEIQGTAAAVHSGEQAEARAWMTPSWIDRDLDRVKALIRDRFDHLSEEAKNVFENYFCCLVAQGRGLYKNRFGVDVPASDFDDLASLYFDHLDPTDFLKVEKNFKKEINSIPDYWTFWGYYNKAFKDSDTRLRNGIVDDFLQKLHEKFPPDVRGDPNSGFTDRVKFLLSRISQRVATVRAWVQVDLGSGTHDFVEVYPRHGDFTISVDGHDYPVKPGESWGWEQARLGGLDSGNAFLKWSNSGLPNSSSIALRSVNSGDCDFFTLTFVFQANRNQASSLGLIRETDREYRTAVGFLLGRQRRIEIVNPIDKPLSRPFSGTVVCMNGFAEADVSVGAGLSIGMWPVFSPSPGEQRFWMIGAARSDNSDPGTWSFSEGSIKCLIRCTKVATHLGIQMVQEIDLYPDGWNDEIGAISTWQSSKSLPSPSAQTDSFGAMALPLATGRSARYSLPEGAMSGDLAFGTQMPYASYNWEIFYHAPLLIATQLSRQHRFEDADRWLRLIFDPTSSEPGTNASRFMRFRVFRDLIGGEGVRDELELIARVEAGATLLEGDDAQRIRKLIERWRDQPYRPFLIARRRHVAFLWKTLFAYGDNLIAWADDLFRRDTRETVAEAAMLYVLAARIIGRRPRVAGKPPERPAMTFDQLASKLDAFANAWIAVSSPASKKKPSRSGSKDASGGLAISERWAELTLSIGSLYFCIPYNDKLTGYWDIVEDRLFKIRHCRNIDGIARDLPFVDPPIDPELLVRAVAAGLDIGEVLAGLQAPPPQQRFAVLHARANELANETRNLGGALLAALEKRDAEALGLLRASHEVELLQRVHGVRKQQIEEAQANIDALRASRKSLEARFEHLARQLGKDDLSAPEFGQTGAAISMLGSTGTSLASKGSELGLIREEEEQIIGYQGARDWALAAGVMKVVSGSFHVVASPLMVMDKMTGAGSVMSALGHGFSALGDGLSIGSQEWRAYADQQGMRAGHIRRRDEWAYQANQTLKDIEQIDKQILASQIRQAIAEAELANQTRQIEQAQAVDEYLRTKYTNVELYQWMEGELSGLHARAYRLALDLARQAQNAAIRELGLPATGLNEITNTHWNGMHSGLLAGEKLAQDLKRLEMAYHKENKRELELTKHVSLRLLSPQALVELKTTGKCDFSLPEWLFDMDAPGHYLRRIKTVSLSVPCVVGPYTGVNCTLTLLSSDIRRSTSLPYPRKEDGDDSRFDATQYGKLDLIVTSSGRDDSGLFEVNLRDERYLPFEHAGAISTWRLEIPNDPAQFDHDTIGDVILHLRYTARSGGDSTSAFAQAAKDSLKGNPPTDLRVLLSLKHDFAVEWQLARSASGDGTFLATVDDRFRPYSARALGLMVDGMDGSFGVSGFLGLKRDAAGAMKQAQSGPSGAFIPGDSNHPDRISLEDVRNYDDVIALLVLKP